MKEFVFQGNPWISRFDCRSEQRMRQGFLEVAREVCLEETLYRKDKTTFYAGMELEFPLISAQDFSLTPQSVRDDIIKCHPQYSSVELGAHQIEIIHEPPINIRHSGIRPIEDDLQANLTPMWQEVQKKNAIFARIGCYPLTKLDKTDYTKGDSKYAKYERSPLWHMAHQRPDATKALHSAESVDVSNAYVVALMNSVQITIDAESFTDAVDKLNRSLMISPMAVALGANARYLDLLDTGYADVRFVAWEISHDSRSYEEVANGRQTRVGLPRRYYNGVHDYFRRILTYPFIMDDPVSLEHPFEVGVGLYWRDARLKFFRDKKTIAVEFRPVALQPTLHEDVAMMMFFLGRLLWGQYKKEILLPMQYVRENKNQAMRDGMKCKLYSFNDCASVVQLTPAKIALVREIDRAEEGLRLFGIEMSDIKYFFEPLRQRLFSGSPAECFAVKVKEFECKQKLSRKESLILAMQELNLV